MNAVDQILQFVACIFVPGDWVEIRLIKSPAVRKRWCLAENLAAMTPELEAANREGWNIFIGPNPRKGDGLSSDANVATFRVLFCDFDKIKADGCSPAEIALSRIEDAKLPAPALVLFSGHGCHAYFRLAAPIDGARWRSLQQRINQAVDADPTICNAERIMRAPTFLNWKDPTKPIEAFIVESHAAAVYPVEEFERVLPPLAAKQPPATPAVGSCTTARAKEGKARATLCALKWPPCGEGSRNTEAYRHAAYLRKDWDLSEPDAWEILRDWNQTNTPPLDESELRKVFADADKYAKHAPGSKLAESRPARQPPRRPQLPATAAATDPACELANLLEAQIDGRFVNLPWPWPWLTDLAQSLTPGTRTLVVGGAGASKSLAVLQALRLWIELGIKVAILALERGRDFHLARVLAQRVGIADVTKSAWVREHPDMVRALFAEHREYLNRMGKAIFTIPRQFSLAQGAEWIEQQAAEGARIIAIDPATALSRGRESWIEDEQFLARVEKVARTSGASIILVSHPKKGGTNLPDLDNIAGGAAWVRFSDSVIWLESHDAKLGTIRTACGTDEQKYNRTLWLLKTRSGEGEHLRLAYRFQSGKDESDDGALVLRELGILVKTRKQ